ncbi:hypothetical protein ACET3Z_025282 [Daucus carota]
MAEAFVADRAAGLIGKIVSLAAQEVIQAWNFNKDLEKLGVKFETIVALLDDAHTKSITMPSARIWFTRLQDVAHDTEAFMDELSYEVTRRNVEKHRKVREFFIPSKNSLVYRFKVARKIKSIHASYDDIFKLAGDIGLRPAQHSTVQPRVIRNKPPYEDTPFIVGRDNNISNLVQTVCQNNQQDLHVVAIIGMGGQGKTTLASMVFHSDDIIMMFTKRMWINHHSVTVKTGLELNHVSKATYLRLDKRVSDRSLQILKTGFGQVRSLHAGEDVFHDVLPYITHLTVLVLNSDGSGLMNVAELPELLRYMKYVKHLDISCLRCKVSGYNITELYNLQTLRVWDLEEHPQMFYKLINLRHLYIKKYLPSRCMFNRIERLTCLQTLPHFIVSKDQNCGIEQLEGLHNLGGEVKLYGLGDVRNRQEARKAKLPTKSNIESLLLNWKTDEDESANYSEQESVLEGLEPHTNTKELIIEYFMGKRLASWITKMINLVEIRFSECQRCEEFPSLGHLPKLRKMKLEKLYNLRIIGSHVGLASNGGAAENVTTMYPSLTELRLWHLPKLEEWVEPDMSRDHISVQVFPKLAVLFMHSCPNLSWMPDSCFPSLKELTITNSKMIPEAMSTKVSSLRSVRFRDMHISDPVVEELLKNSSQSLRSLDLSYCLGLTRLTFGIALEELSVWDLPNLTSIHAVKDETLSLRALCIVKCSSLSEYPKSVSSIIERLQVDKISHVNNIGTSFPVLTTLKLTEFERSRLEFDDHHVLALPAVTQLEILHCTELKAIPDAIADLPSLQLLSIRNCELVESLPTFHPSHSIQRLEMKSCGALYPGYSTKTAAERYKIRHIPIIKWRW